jgi:hypothetical protein
LWIPHFTIASLDAADWPLIEENLLADAPSGEFRMGAAKIYWLVDGEPCVVESFPLS